MVVRQRNMEQRCVLKLYVKFRESASVIFEKLNTALRNIQLQKLTKSSNVRADGRSSLRMLTEQLHLNRFTVHQIKKKTLLLLFCDTMQYNTKEADKIVDINISDRSILLNCHSDR